MDIEWRPSIFPHYEVSSAGGVRSKAREVRIGRNGTRKVGGVELRPSLSGTGYPMVKIDGKVRSVHRLVALAFCDGYAEGLHVNHKNGIRHDNRVSNLEWVTVSENCKDGYVRGRVSPFTGRFGVDHGTSKAVVAVNIESGECRRYGSGMDAVREGFASAAISRCCHGQSMSHKGWRWSFDQP